MSQEGLSLAEALTRYLATLPPQLRQESQQELNRFARWHGGGRLINGIRAQEIAEYAESLSPSSDAVKSLETIKGFLTYAKKEGLTESNLAVHLRLGSSAVRRRTKLRRGGQKQTPLTLTTEGYTALKSELASLKQERPHLVEEIRLAAADKDFRENAPLEAAKERQGQIETRIKELESILTQATIADETPSATEKVAPGCTVTLRDLDSGEELNYSLVNPREAEPAAGKLSIASPLGKALLDRGKGEVVEVAAPLGRLCYRIEGIIAQHPASNASPKA